MTCDLTGTKIPPKQGHQRKKERGHGVFPHSKNSRTLGLIDEINELQGIIHCINLYDGHLEVLTVNLHDSDRDLQERLDVRLQATCFDIPVKFDDDDGCLRALLACRTSGTVLRGRVQGEF